MRERGEGGGRFQGELNLSFSRSITSSSSRSSMSSFSVSAGREIFASRSFRPFALLPPRLFRLLSTLTQRSPTTRNSSLRALLSALGSNRRPEKAIKKQPTPHQTPGFIPDGFQSSQRERFRFDFFFSFLFLPLPFLLHFTTSPHLSFDLSIGRSVRFPPSLHPSSIPRLNLSSSGSLVLRRRIQPSTSSFFLVSETQPCSFSFTRGYLHSGVEQKSVVLVVHVLIQHVGSSSRSSLRKYHRMVSFSSFDILSRSGTRNCTVAKDE